MTQAALQFDAHTLLLGLLGMVCGFLAYWGTRLEQRVDELKARQCLLAEEMHKSYVPREDCRERTAQILGVTMPENFRQPFFSKTISEFWKRWHITLGTWFKDYVYIPLGGSRNGTWRTYRNLIIVFFSQDSGTRAVGILLSGAYTMCCFSSLSGWAVMSFWIGCRGFCSTSIRCLSSWWAGLSSGQKIWKTRCTT